MSTCGRVVAPTNRCLDLAENDPWCCSDGLYQGGENSKTAVRDEKLTLVASPLVSSAVSFSTTMTTTTTSRQMPARSADAALTGDHSTLRHGRKIPFVETTE